MSDEMRHKSGYANGTTESLQPTPLPREMPAVSGDRGDITRRDLSDRTLAQSAPHARASQTLGPSPQPAASSRVTARRARRNKGGISLGLSKVLDARDRSLGKTKTEKAAVSSRAYRPSRLLMNAFRTSAPASSKRASELARLDNQYRSERDALWGAQASRVAAARFDDGDETQN